MMDSYLAGAGASGSLLAGGGATFDAWPPADGLLPGGSDVTLGTGAATQAPSAVGPDLIGLLGHRRGAAHGQRAHLRTDAHGRSGDGGDNEGIQGGGVPDSPGQDSVPPSGSPGSGSGSGSDNIVQKTVSDLGNAVESNTTALGQQVGASTSPQVGDLVTGVGGT